MKTHHPLKWTTLIALAMFSLASFAAGLDRSKAPKAGPAPEIQMGDYTTIEMKNGLKVIVVPNRKLPTLSISLVVDWDPILEKDKAGMLQMAGSMLRRGTKTRSKTDIDAAVDLIGASLFTSASQIQGSSLSKHGEALFAIMADIAKHADFKESELEKVRTEAISNIKSGMDSPDQIMDNVRSAVLYGSDHPYGEISTEASVAKVTSQDLKKFHRENFLPNISYLAMVGDITTDQAKAWAEKHLGDWQRGNVIERNYAKADMPAKRQVAIVDKAGAVQTVLHLANVMDLKPAAPDAIKARVTNILLGGPQFRLYANLREDKGYTYGAYARFDSDKVLGEFRAYATVRNEVTKDAMKEFLFELNRIRNEAVTAQELEVAKNFTAGDFARRMENSNTIARYVINMDRYDLPPDYYANYLKEVASTTPADVKAIANKYIHPERLTVFAVGKADELEEALAEFGEITRYDAYGQPIDETALALPEGLTAEAVIDRYIEAVGGLAAIEAVQDMHFKGKMGIGGMSLDFLRKQKAPNMSLTAAMMNGQTMFKQVFNGETGSTVQMGNKTPMDEDTKTSMKLESYFVPERLYKDWEIKPVLSGAEMVNDRLTYRLDMTLPGGTKQVSYFDAETGLKARVVRTVEGGPTGQTVQTTDFLDYRTINGLQLSFVSKISAGPQSMEFKTDSIELNTGLSDDEFKLD